MFRRAVSRLVAEGVRPITNEEMQFISGGQEPVNDPPGSDRWVCPGGRITARYPTQGSFPQGSDSDCTN